VEIVSEEYGYADGDVPLTGYLVRPEDAAQQPAPALLLVHGGAGLDEHARAQARRYAALGCVVLACDMFGPGVAGDRGRVTATLTAMRDDPDLLLQRASSGLDGLRTVPDVGRSCAAIGYCFGGMTVLRLARSGADLAGVISMHGSLATKRPAAAGAVKAQILVCHGARDPHVPLRDVTAFIDEMQQAQADWQLIVYGNAVHGFTHADAVPGAIPGVVYDAVADRRSFQAACDFLAEVLPLPARSASGQSHDDGSSSGSAG
jgi:dienelactone hydrolase